jgi:cyclic di-GMP phosphodiesterase
VKRDVAAQVVQNLNDSILRSPEANLLLMQARRFDRDLFSHAVNVCVLALVVNASEVLGVDPPALGLGALLHDVGETRIPHNLMRRKEGFTEVELRLVEQHPKLGALLLPREQFPEIVRSIALEHHERCDGSGYPQRAKGDAIQLASRIVAITDLYDDMLTGRNQSTLAPIEILRRLFLEGNAGTLDKPLVEKIIRCLGVYPIGSLVELSTGERGIVVATNKSDALKPTIRIISSTSGFRQSNGPVINLADAGSGSLNRRIVNALDTVRERINPLEFLKLSIMES